MMEEIKTIAEVLNAGGNAALLLCAYYIHNSTKAYTRVADRLARIESLARIEPKPEIDQPTDGAK